MREPVVNQGFTDYLRIEDPSRSGRHPLLAETHVGLPSSECEFQIRRVVHIISLEEK